MNEDFRFEYEPGTLLYGRDCVAELDSELERVGAERALVVTGRTVGATPAVMEPIREGAGDRLGGIFAETTPEKALSTALDGAQRLQETAADALVSVGGGSSLDVAKLVSVLAAYDEPDRDTIQAMFEERGTVPVPEGDLTPVIAVPTTLAGADLSVVAGITSQKDGLVRGGVFDERLMPEALFYDPALFETTPHGVLCASAMNGFDKGVETLYAKNATPISDGTAMRGLRLLGRGLPRLGDGIRDKQTFHDVIVGTMLVQYGCSRSDGTTLSLIHAFGHGIARGYNIQQGGAHGIIAPHALELLFSHVDGRRELLAEALGVDGEADLSDGIVDAITNVRDALGLPSQLREISDMDESDLPDVAASVVDDSFMANTPENFDPSVDDIENVLRQAW